MEVQLWVVDSNVASVVVSGFHGNFDVTRGWSLGEVVVWVLWLDDEAPGGGFQIGDFCFV